MTTTRTLAAEVDGPISIDASLMGHYGSITVRTASGCERASVIVRTTDETGSAAEAITEATLCQTATGLAVRVRGDGSAGVTIINGGGRGGTVVQSFGSVTGSVTGMVINAGGSVVTGGGVVVTGQPIGPSPIHITVVVPEASTVTARAQSASIDTDGVFESVSADTQSGSISIEQATRINTASQSGTISLGHVELAQANTMSGAITIDDLCGTAQLRSMSGSIRLHATTGGTVTADTMTGAIAVTATDNALAEGLNVQAHSMTGTVRTPRRSQTTGS